MFRSKYTFGQKTFSAERIFRPKEPFGRKNVYILAAHRSCNSFYELFVEVKRANIVAGRQTLLLRAGGRCCCLRTDVGAAGVRVTSKFYF
jgi:hypothetical protein